ncbi:helix-turn-helix domain-containing protein [Sphingorhabdus contaminans]|uniref:Helix-turn-helix domain-containing protein n=1 Tax=Sphingorhabdus contaminans TaxID=1343899 RepID=A0A553WH55_9SPHN|nr:helix-turn-helix domain-containing protein [Sphingorhabdus contaminans]
MEQLLVRTTEAFNAIGVKRTKGFELIASGDLESVKIGRATRIPTESIRAYVARLRADRTGA